MNRTGWFKKSYIGVTAFIDLICLALIFLIIIVQGRDQKNVGVSNGKLSTNTQPTIAISVVPIPTIVPTATTIPTITVSPIKSSKILFGIGSEAGPAEGYRIVKEAPVHMLTSWYNGPKDLEWMQDQKNDLIPRLYTKGYTLHLITYTDLPEDTLTTPYGVACGRAYPVSTQIVEDMKQLAQIFTGNGLLYVSLFTEFQTYPCSDNNWVGNENYYKTLKDNFRQIKDIFRQYAPKSKIGISWGGWQNRYDDSANGGGRSLFPLFADIMTESDFTAFQTMGSDTNIGEMLDMTRILGAYGKPVMLSHYKPASGSQEIFDSDMRKLFTDEVIHQLTNNGLFAFSLMDDENINNSETSYQLVKAGIQKYGK